MAYRSLICLLGSAMNATEIKVFRVFVRMCCPPKQSSGSGLGRRALAGAWLLVEWSFTVFVAVLWAADSYIQKHGVKHGFPLKVM